MADLQQAIENASRFATHSLGPERTRGIRLEEVESSQITGKPVWLITLSSLEKPSHVSPAAALLGADPVREYKVFAVAKDDGEILSMKIRLLSTGTTN